jgi:voltage-gated potassium channel Kch
MEHHSLRLQIHVILFAGVMVLGTFGFMRLEGLSLADASYFSIVTIATVGYGDIVPHTPAGKALAILLIVVGVGIFLGVIANAMEMVLQKLEKKIRMEKMNMVIGLFSAR